MQRLTVGDAKPEEIDMIEELTYQLDGRSICALGDAAAWPIQGLIRHFRPLMEQRIAEFAAKKGPHIVNTDVVDKAVSMYATK
jgi:NADH:ubiquinone oxidoreductase subunit F (NADH-binding)